MGRIFASRDGNIYQHYRAVPRPQPGRGYLLEQRGGAATTFRDGPLKAHVIQTLRDNGRDVAEVEAVGAEMREAVEDAKSDRDKSLKIIYYLTTRLGIDEDDAAKMSRHRTFTEVNDAGPMNDLASYMEDGPNATWSVTGDGLRPPATNPDVARVVDADGNVAPVAGQGAPAGKRTSFPLSFLPGSIPDDPRRPDERPSAPPPDQPSAPPPDRPSAPPTDGDDGSSDESGDDGYETTDEPPSGPVDVASASTGAIQNAAATLAPVANGIDELSPEQRAQLLQAVARSGGFRGADAPADCSLSRETTTRSLPKTPNSQIPTGGWRGQQPRQAARGPRRAGRPPINPLVRCRERAETGILPRSGL